MSDADIARIGELLARFNAGDEGAIRDLISPRFFEYTPEDDEPDAAAVWSGYLAQFRAAAPDLELQLVDLKDGADGSLHGTGVISGTWTGELWNAPPSGRSYRFELPVRIKPVGDRYAVNIDLEAPAALAILREMGLVNAADQMHLPPPHPVIIDDFMIKVMFTGQVEDKPCRHLQEVQVTSTTAETCDDCEPGEIWPALRLCLACGHVGCCDTSVHKHAKSHWEQTGHPLMRSIRMDEGWMWCYEDNAAFQKRRLEQIEARLSEGA